jgi:hypothetical protein
MHIRKMANEAVTTIVLLTLSSHLPIKMPVRHVTSLATQQLNATLGVNRYYSPDTAELLMKA